MTPATYALAVGSLLLCVLLWDSQLRQLLYSVSLSMAGTMHTPVSLSMAGTMHTPTKLSKGHMGPIDVLLDQLSHTNSEEKPGVAAGVHGALARLLDADGKSDAALRHHEAAVHYAKIAAAAAPPALKLGDGILWAGKEKELFFDARTQLVEAYLAHGSLALAEKQANEQLDDLVGLDPSYIASAFRMAARIRCNLGHPKSALRLLKFAKERLDMTSDPEGPDELVRVLLGTVEAHLQLQEISDARQLVQQAQRILCGSEGFAMQCGSTCPVDKPELQAELQQALGDVALASTGMSQATACYKEALKLEAQVQPRRHQRIVNIETTLQSLQTGKEPAASKSTEKGTVEDLLVEDVVSI